MKIERWKNGRHWAIYDENGELIAVVVYKKGAKEIVKRLMHR
jgi:antitoxin component YwqK of YwqJK toxin-antitoxin module